jgi:hypothetical protein
MQILTDEIAQLAAFGAAILARHDAECNFFDACTGAQLQAYAVKAGTMVWVRENESCGGGCVCARTPGVRFPVDCLTIPEAVRGAMNDLAPRVGVRPRQV